MCYTEDMWFKVLILLFVVSAFCSPALAESVMYMDSSGNIQFVESISQVPSDYRWQVLPPTPGPPKDLKARKKWDRDMEKARKQKELAERKRKKAEEREKKRKEKEETRLLKKAQEAEEKAREKENKQRK